MWHHIYIAPEYNIYDQIQHDDADVNIHTIYNIYNILL